MSPREEEMKRGEKKSREGRRRRRSDLVKEWLVWTLDALHADMELCEWTCVKTMDIHTHTHMHIYKQKTRKHTSLGIHWTSKTHICFVTITAPPTQW